MQTMKSIVKVDEWNPKQIRTVKVSFVTCLVLLCMGATVYGHLVLGTDIVYTHLFYIPVVLAGFWWGRRAIWVALLLSGWLLACDGLSTIGVRSTPAYTSDILRGAMVVLASIVVGGLRERNLKATRTLQETREYLTRLIQHSRGAIVVWDRHRKITLFNSAIEQITGYSADEMVGQSLDALFPDESREEALRRIHEAAEGELWEAVEIPIRSSDGQVAICLWNSANIYEPDGKTPTATVAHGQDITERVRTEKRIRHLNSVLRAVRDVNQLIVVEKDRATLLQKSCNALVEARGYDAAWLAFSKDGESFDIVAGSGPGEKTSRIANHLVRGDLPHCVKTMLAHKEKLLIFDKPRECGECPYRSAYAGQTTVIIRVEHSGKLFGLLAISLGTDIAADDEEQRLLTEIASDLAIALRNMELEEAHQRTEEKMAESEERYRLLAENAADVIWTLDTDLRLTYVSPSAARLTGYSVEETMAQTIEQMLTPDSTEVALKIYAEAVAAEAPGSQDAPRTLTLDLEYICKDGSIIWAETVATILRDPDGRPFGILGATRNVTERKLAEEALHRRDAILEAIGHAATQLLTEGEVIGIKWEQNIEEVLRRLGLATGVSRVALFKNRPGDDGEILTTHLFAWDAPGITLPVDDSERSGFPLAAGGFARWVKLLGRGDLIHGHVRDFPASEREKLMLGQLPMKSTAVAPIFVGQEWWGFIAFDDYHAEREWSGAEIEALKTAASLLGATIQRGRAEEEQARLEAELRHSQKMEAIGSLAGGVAHDFNNILTVILGYTEFALKSIGEDDPVRRDLNEVRRASIRAAALTRQLLLFSRRQPMMMGPLDLNEVIRNLTKMLERLVGEDIALATNLGSDVWTIEADSGTIDQVIMNLVVNSRDALPQGGEISIQTQNLRVDEEYCQTRTYARPGEFVCLSVTDTGTGMSPDIMDRIFEPFFTTKGPGKGTGMGLAVVYGIVKQHQGWIDVESSPDQGTTFRVYLPTTSTKPTQAQASPASTEVSRGKGERILLVEDEESIRDFAFRGLSEHGYVVCPAASAQEALEAFRQEKHQFDLIFCDLILTDGSGLKLAQRLLGLRPDTKVIFASGYSADKEDWRIIRKEGHPFLQKPYSLSDLLRVVREVLG